MNRKVIQAFCVVAILLLAASFFVAGVPGSVLTVGAIAFAIAAILMALTVIINLVATLVGKYYQKRRSI